MSRKDQPLARPDPWSHLRAITPARIALGRAGGSLPTRPQLDFQLAHALAQDAVWDAYDGAPVVATCNRLNIPVVEVSTAATDRETYLARPDLGRTLDEPSRSRVAQLSRDYDLALAVSDGLAAGSLVHAASVLEVLVPLVAATDWRIAPVVLVRHGRVAVQDQIGQLLGARVSVILLGERPGLLAPDSLGAYLVYDPRPGRTDAERNCISNIRPSGLPPAVAAEQILALLRAMLTHRVSGLAVEEFLRNSEKLME